MYFKLPHHLFGPQGNDHLQLHCFYFMCHFQLHVNGIWILHHEKNHLTNYQSYQLPTIQVGDLLLDWTSDFRPCSLLLQSDSYPYRQEGWSLGPVGIHPKNCWNRWLLITHKNTQIHSKFILVNIYLNILIIYVRRKNVRIHELLLFPSSRSKWRFIRIPYSNWEPPGGHWF